MRRQERPPVESSEHRQAIVEVLPKNEGQALLSDANVCINPNEHAAKHGCPARLCHPPRIKALPVKVL
jgi:hypothetical protein